MTAPGVSPADALKARAMAAKDQLDAAGISQSDWAREHGFSIWMVNRVLNGLSPCRTGEAHRIAVALGIKQPAPPPAPIATGMEQVQ